MEKTEAVTLCKKHVHRYVMIQMKDGAVYDGIIESVDSENIYLAVPVGGMTMPSTMPAHVHHGSNCGCGGGYAHGPMGGFQGHMGHHGQHGHHDHHVQHDHHGQNRVDPFYGPGFYGPGFYGPGFYGPGFFGPRRRFNRVILPLAAFTALSLLPYF